MAEARTLSPPLQQFLHLRHKVVGSCAVNHPVIKGQADVAHRPNGDRVADDDDPLLDRANGADAAVCEVMLPTGNMLRCLTRYNDGDYTVYRSGT